MVQAIFVGYKLRIQDLGSIQELKANQAHHAHGLPFEVY